MNLELKTDTGLERTLTFTGESEVIARFLLNWLIEEGTPKTTAPDERIGD